MEDEEVDTSVLGLVRRFDRGLIHYDAAHVRPSALIGQLARAWPRRKVIVVATRVDEARLLQKELRDHVAQVGLFTGRHHLRRGVRVDVATWNRLGDGAIQIERKDIYVEVNPHELFATYADAGLEGVRHLACARVYGLLADGARVAPWQRSWMTALFGTKEVHVPRHGHHDLPVDVVFTRVCGPRPPSRAADLDLKRRGVWEHPVRNRRIAGLFQALTKQDEGQLQERFADVADRVRGRLGGRVGLLVESVEHGLALARLFPGVLFITGNDPWPEGLTPKQVKLTTPLQKKQRAKGHAIVTSTGLGRVEPFEILIRADAGRGLPALPDAYRAVPDDEDIRLLLIDFRDEHHPALRRWSRERRQAYVSAHWNLMGQAPRTPLELFLAGRPEVRR